MKRIHLLLPMLILTAACEKIDLEGIEETKSYYCPVFSGIEVSDGLSVTVCDPASHITATADIAVIRELHIQVDGGTLRVYLPERIAGKYKADVMIPHYSLDSVILSGGSTFLSDIPYQVESMTLTLSGGSTCRIPVTCKSAKVNLSGGSSLKESYCGSGLTCDRLSGSLSGGSDLTCHSDGKIDCSLSGGSVITYTGNATTSGCKTSGGSKVSHKDNPA